jgi:hypothetical protein
MATQPSLPLLGRGVVVVDVESEVAPPEPTGDGRRFILRAVRAVGASVPMLLKGVEVDAHVAAWRLDVPPTLFGVPQHAAAYSQGRPVEPTGNHMKRPHVARRPP